MKRLLTKQYIDTKKCLLIKQNIVKLDHFFYAVARLPLGFSSFLKCWIFELKSKIKCLKDYFTFPCTGVENKILNHLVKFSNFITLINIPQFLCPLYPVLKI